MLVFHCDCVSILYLFEILSGISQNQNLLGVICHWYRLTCVQNLMVLASAVSDISLGDPDYDSFQCGLSSLGWDLLWSTTHALWHTYLIYVLICSCICFICSHLLLICTSHCFVCSSCSEARMHGTVYQRIVSVLMMFLCQCCHYYGRPME